MTRTETRPTTIIILTIWILITGFAVAAFAREQGVAASPSSNSTSEAVANGQVGDLRSTALIFDLNSLPSVDFIVAKTDVVGFMQRGVPDELRLSALRRAWSRDPAIRDFKGLQENDYDFDAGSSSIAGFGEFGDVDSGHVRRMIAGLFSEPPRLVVAQGSRRSDSSSRFFF